VAPTVPVEAPAVPVQPPAPSPADIQVRCWGVRARQGVCEVLGGAWPGVQFRGPPGWVCSDRGSRLRFGSVSKRARIVGAGLCGSALVACGLLTRAPTCYPTGHLPPLHFYSCRQCWRRHPPHPATPSPPQHRQHRRRALTAWPWRRYEQRNGSSCGGGTSMKRGNRCGPRHCLQRQAWHSTAQHSTAQHGTAQHSWQAMHSGLPWVTRQTHTAKVAPR